MDSPTILNMPTEIRLRIYGVLFVDFNIAINWENWDSLEETQHNVLLTCRQVYTEAIDLYNSSASLHLSGGVFAYRLAEQRKRLLLAKVKLVHINVHPLFGQPPISFHLPSLQTVVFDVTALLRCSDIKRDLESITMHMVYDMINNYAEGTNLLDGIRDIAESERDFTLKIAVYGCKGNDGSLVVSIQQALFRKTIY